MGHISKNKYDNILSGIIVSILAPIIFYFLVYHKDLRYIRVIDNDLTINLMKYFLPIIIKSCLFADALVFFVFIWLNMNKAAKGVFFVSATALIALVLQKFAPVLFT